MSLTCQTYITVQRVVCLPWKWAKFEVYFCSDMWALRAFPFCSVFLLWIWERKMYEPRVEPQLLSTTVSYQNSKLKAQKIFKNWREAHALFFPLFFNSQTRAKPLDIIKQNRTNDCKLQRHPTHTPIDYTSWFKLCMKEKHPLTPSTPPIILHKAKERNLIIYEPPKKGRVKKRERER